MSPQLASWCGGDGGAFPKRSHGVGSRTKEPARVDRLRVGVARKAWGEVHHRLVSNKGFDKIIINLGDVEQAVEVNSLECY